MDTISSLLFKTLEKITEATSVGIVITDIHGHIVYVNDYFAQNICKLNTNTLLKRDITHVEEITQQIKHIIISDNELLFNDFEVKQFNTDIILWESTKVSFRIIKIGFIDNDVKYIVTLFINISDQVEIYSTLKKREEKYRNLLNSVPVGLLVINAKTLEIKEVNKNTLSIINISNISELKGKTLQEVIKLDKDSLYDRVIDSWGKGLHYECNVAFGNTEKYLQFNFTSLLIEDEQCYIVTIVDITPLQKVQEELTLSHSQIKYLLSAIDSILIGVSHNDIITNWNRTAEKIFGISQNEAVGKNIIGFKIPWEWDKIYIGITNSIVEQRPVTLPDVRYETIYGQKRLLGITVNPILDDTGNVLGYLLFGRDVTDKRINEAEIIQAQKLQSIGQLAAGIAHEINTPAQYVNDNLHYIKDTVKDFDQLMSLYDGCISLLQNAKQLPQRLRLFVEEIARLKKKIDYDFYKQELPKAVDQSLEGINKIVSIVKSLKSFAHPDTQKKVIININSLLEDVITITRNEWKYIADITTNFKQAEIMIPCFPNQLNQVFLNMIINARDAIQEAIDKKLIEKGHIKITTDMDAEFAIVGIQDNGIGIPEEIKSKIFDPFFTTKEVGKGTGQGLAISHSIVYDKHKGKIRVESKYGKGSTFYVHLPLHEHLL
jgi:PAS domain S-box-containing protein